jgi:hypothetical protein
MQYPWILARVDTDNVSVMRSAVEELFERRGLRPEVVADDAATTSLRLDYGRAWLRSAC